MKIKYPVYQPFLGGREKELVNDCLDSNWISSKGKYVSLFEEKFAEFVGVRHAVSVSNGTVALHVALAALGIGPGDEVLVPSLTYIASSNAVAYTGAKPVLVDSEPVFWQIDVEDAEKKITDRTKAIMPVHLYGHPCNMDAISKLAEKYSLSVIEDCAEALGSKYNNIHVGTFGDVGTFSFFGNKTITTGEGGMVVTNEDHLADAIRHLKGQGLAPDREYWHDVIGFNYRMTNICAAIGVAQLENVRDVLVKKRELSCWYNEVLADTDLLIQPEADNCHHSYWMVSVLAGSESSRDSLREGLRDEGIETRPVFNPIHLMSLYDFPTSCLPHAEDLSKRGFSLPSYPELTRRDVELIGSVMKSNLSSVIIQLGLISTMIKVGILAHEFLINTGANDFLKNLIRGLASDSELELLFLCPLSDQKIEHATPANLKEKFRKYPRIKNAARAIARKMRPLTDVVIKDEPYEYAHYLEACPNMQILPCSTDPDSLRQIRDEMGIDIFFPSIHILPPDIPYITYWPDCQPKHLPEFFDDEAQRVRDERILGLLASANPMIINSRDAKQDMIRFYSASEHQIYDLPFAPIIEVNRLIPRPELLKKYSVGKPYFIVCNQFWIHKSAETVIQAAALCRERGMDVNFLFTGKMEEPRKPAYIEYIKELTKNLGVQDIVQFLGYVPKADQLELIKNSIAVVQPTLFEGGPGGGAVYDSYSLGIRAIVSDLPINYELPLDSGRITLFKKQCPEDLVEKLYHHVVTPYAPPPVEDLYQQSVQSTKLLSSRIKESILAALAQRVW